MHDDDEGLACVGVCAQERDPRAYQLFVSDGHGTSFLACTPERLYARTGRMVASEAVAATRARGPPGAPRANPRLT